MVETQLMHDNVKSYDIKNCAHDDVTKIMKDKLEKLSYSTRMAKLGKNIIKINYYDTSIDENLQRENKILILQDPNNDCHINFKGKLNSTQISELWSELNRSINKTEQVIVENTQQLCREDATYMIIDMIEKQGFEIDTLRAIEFIENFQNRYNRLPYENEILPIVKGYILTQSSIKDKTMTTYVPSPKSSTNTISSVQASPKPIQSAPVIPEPIKTPEPVKVPTLIKAADYIKPNEINTTITYQEPIKSPQPAIKNISVSNPVNTTYSQDSIEKKVQSIKSGKTPVIVDESSSGLLTIQKPIGRRTCPNCGNNGEYKIHEIIDKSDLLCLFPRLYGKKYSCDGCKIEWKEI